MQQENSIRINQRELATEYGHYVEAKNKKGFIQFFIKALMIPVFALLFVLAGAAFLIANNKPDMYAQAKDIIFANVDFEKLTGIPDSTAREQLDNWLILNSEQQQGVVAVQKNTTPKLTAQ